MAKTHRYSIGGYEGDQLQPIVRAILNDADAHPLRRVPLRELVDELQKHLTAFDPLDGPACGARDGQTAPSQSTGVPCTCPIDQWSARFGDHAEDCPSFRQK